MNMAVFFQKYEHKRIVHICQRLYSMFVLRSNEKRIKYLRDAGALIGDNVRIGKVEMLGTEPYLVEIGDNTYITGGDTKILTHDGACALTYWMGLYPRKCDYLGRVKIGKNCFIGNNCIILKHVTIGDNCIIGAGSVVSKSIPANSVAAGVPAKVICSVEDFVARNAQYYDDTNHMTQYEKRLFVLAHMDKYEQMRKAREISR